MPRPDEGREEGRRVNEERLQAPRVKSISIRVV